MKALNRLTTRRFPATDVYTIDQARELLLLSRALGRQLGMLIDRKGRVDMVLVGEAGGILIPELPRARSGADRLRGLRLLHTPLTPDGLSQEDLMDLLFLRLDAIIVLTVNPDGTMPLCTVPGSVIFAEQLGYRLNRIDGGRPGARTAVLTVTGDVVGAPEFVAVGRVPKGMQPRVDGKDLVLEYTPVGMILLVK